MSAPAPSTTALNCVNCLGTGRRSHPEWEGFWAGRDLLYLAGLTDAEIDDQTTPPDCPETQRCPHPPAPQPRVGQKPAGPVTSPPRAEKV